MSRYAILTTWWKYGSMLEHAEKEKVKSICENIKERYNKRKDIYIRIEVVNTDTGEIREYWNNHENKINF